MDGMISKLTVETEKSRKENELAQKRLTAMESRVEYLEPKSRRNNLIFMASTRKSR